MSGRVFVQDTGTGLQDDNEQDWLDAANLMALSHSPNDSGYVVDGLELTPDFANGEVSVSSGQCKVTATDVQTTDHSLDTPRSVDQYTWPEVTATVLVDSGTVTISSTGETDIWVDSGLDSTTPDDVSFVTSEPSGPGIHIGTVDADAETVDELNRSPDAQFNDLSATSGEFDAVSTESASIGELNNTYYVDAGTDTLGADLNSLIGSVEEGAEIIIPPGLYEIDETVTPDKSISLRGASSGEARHGSKSLPEIRRIDGGNNVPFIETSELINIRGLEFNATSENDADWIVAHNQVDIRDVGFRQGGVGIYLHQASSDDNLNNSTVSVRTGRQMTDDVIKAENTSGTSRELNGMRLHVESSFQNSGYAINLEDGFGNELSAGQIEGGDHVGGVRVGDDSNDVFVRYMEANINQGIVFDDNRNTGRVIHSGLDYDDTYILNSSANVTEHMGGNGKLYRSGADLFRFDGGVSVLGGPLVVDRDDHRLVILDRDGQDNLLLTVTSNNEVLFHNDDSDQNLARLDLDTGGLQLAGEVTENVSF